MRACDYNVYRIDYNTEYHERHSTYGGMDSELTGRMVKEKRSYLCVAPDKTFAVAAFMRYHSKDEIVEWTHIGQLNDLLFLQ